MRRRPSPPAYPSRYSEPPNRPPQPPQDKGKNPFDLMTLSILGGVLIIGIGIGSVITSNLSFSPENVVSREALDQQAPDRDICVQYGASAVAMDMRVFMTLNPFSVYVSQPVMQPGCVIRRNNWAVLEQQGAVSSNDVRDCKNRMNTFAYTGTLRSKPAVNCVYQNDAAQNLFLSPGGAEQSPNETNQF